jgi:hypothetical protein
MLIFIPLASGILRKQARFCFVGLCLVSPVIGSLVWMQEGQFSFHWPLEIHLHC